MGGLRTLACAQRALSASAHLCARGSLPSMRLSGGPSGGGAFVAHAPKSSLSPPPPPPLVGGRAACAVEGSDRWGERTAWGRPRGCRWWRRVCRPRTEVVAVAATTTATCRWTGGVCGRGVGSVGERTAWGPRGCRWWRRVCRPRTEVVAVAATTTATCSGRAACAVEGSARYGGADGMGERTGVVLVFSGAGVGAQETRGVSDWGRGIRAQRTSTVGWRRLL
jgi:hypothetical protein